MKRISSNGIIYKYTIYSDSSCIASVFTEEFGKLKLFMPKAFTKRSGIVKFIPSTLDILRKDNSDLFKLYSYSPHAKYISFLEVPEISIRLNLIFDIIDSLLPLDESYEYLYKLILNINKENVHKAIIYIIYIVFKISGSLPSFYTCRVCNNEINSLSFYLEGDIICDKCVGGKKSHTPISEEINIILKALKCNSTYKNIVIDKTQEDHVLQLFVQHVEVVTSKKLKSFKSFRELLYYL